MKFRDFNIGCALTLISCSLAFAADDPKIAKAEEILRLTRAESGMHQILAVYQNSFKAAFQAQLKNVKFTPEQQKQIDDFEADNFRILSQALSWDNLRPDLAKIYADTFTDSELDNLIAFYKSPAGQALISKTPDVLAKSAAVGQQKVVAIMPEIDKRMRDFMEKLGAHK